MQKEYGTAIGMIETLGMVPAIYGADFMLKAADVELISYENVGSTLVTVIVAGDVSAVRAAVEAGKKAADSVVKLTASYGIPSPIKAVRDIVAVHDATGEALAASSNALGLIEIFGLAHILQATDAMGKAASVEINGYENVASGYISVLAEGDVAACRAAVDAGVKAVESSGGQIYSAVVIPSPHPALRAITERYCFDRL